MDKFEILKRFVYRENAALSENIDTKDNYDRGMVSGIRRVIRLIDAIDCEED
ncbi:hypothetical protein R3O64_09860 [Corynebacterium hesseae]|uniref:hypothetical protein n=1 Tax=Corynebacterium TaxID=1716 RepID=UPI00163D8727|nr:hypothetical protein [Corynebacterium guaraldiae]